MKKRKILLGLALASLFTFSLSACGDDAKEPENPVVDGGDGDDAVEKFDVKFMDGTTELTDLKQSVDKDGKAQKPAKSKLPTKAGKRFDYWSADGLTAYNFDDPVTEAVTLSAVYADQNDYDTLAASNNKVMATDFYDEQIPVNAEYKFTATSLSYATSKDVNVFTKDNKYKINDGALFVDFGRKITDAGVYKIYFETNFDALKGESFAQINGSVDGDSYLRVFELRTGSSKFGYSFDGSTKVESNVAVTTNTEYKILIELDTANGKVSATVNGDKVADNVTSSITAVNGLKFQASANQSAKTIDNVAVTFTPETVSPLVAAKAQALALADTYKDGTQYTSASAELKTYIDDDIEKYKTAVSAATTEDQVAGYVTTWNSYAAAGKGLVPVKAYSAASSAVSSLADKNIYVVDGMTNVEGALQKVNFTGYTISGFYSDDTLATALVASNVTSSTAQIYAKVEAATSVSSEWTAVENEDNFAEGWTLENYDTASGCSWRSQQADGDANNPTSGNYNAYQLFLKAADHKDGRLVYTFSADTKSIVLNITGWTGAGGSVVKDVVAVKVYDKNGTLIETVTVWTSSGKNNGSFTDTSSNTNITITEASNIGKIEIACVKDTKSFYVTSAKVTYSI